MRWTRGIAARPVADLHPRPGQSAQPPRRGPDQAGGRAEFARLRHDLAPVVPIPREATGFISRSGSCTRCTTHS